MQNKQARLDSVKTFVTSHTINTRIDKLLDTPILKDQTSNLSEVLLTPYDRECRKNPEMESQTRPMELEGNRSELLRVIVETLRHFPANPSNQGNVEKLMTSYTFMGNSSRTGKEVDDYVNVKPLRAKAFIKRLISLAKDNNILECNSRNAQQKNPIDLPSGKLNLAYDCRMVLVGDRGIGKTTFLNYLLDAYITTLDRNNVIWVRFDLTLPFSNTEYSIWWRWHVFKVLYDSINNKKMRLHLDSDNGALMTRVKRYNDEYSDKRLIYEYQNLINNLPPDAPGPIPDWAYYGLMDYLTLDKRIGFIFVIDGLDQLGLRRSDLNEYKEKLKALKEHVLQPRAKAAAYLISMRWESYQNSESSEYRNFPFFEVGPVDSYLIYKKKIDCLKKRHLYAPDHYPALFKITESAYGHCIPMVVNAFIRFVGYSLSRTLEQKNEATPEATFRILESMFGTNKRKLFEALVTIANQFFRKLPTNVADRMIKSALNNEIELFNGIIKELDNERYPLYSKYYMVLEALILRGDSYWRPRYVYQWVGKNNTTGAFVTDKYGKSDPDIIVNLFKHPYDGGVDSRLCLFANIRILQLLSVYPSMQRVILETKLTECFAYPKEVLTQLIDGLLDTGLISYFYGGGQIKPNEARITPFGRYTLNHIIYNIEYMSLAVENAPIPLNLALQEYFPISPHYSVDDFVLNNRIVSSVNFIRLLKQIEEMEIKYFKEHADATTQEQLNGIISVVPRISVAIRDTIHNIVNDAFTSKHHESLKEGIIDRVMSNVNKYYGVNPSIFD
jgi:hypothetical protein